MRTIAITIIAIITATWAMAEDKQVQPCKNSTPHGETCVLPDGTEVVRVHWTVGGFR